MSSSRGGLTDVLACISELSRITFTLYDLTDLKADICFGAPTHNDWQKPFSLDDPAGLKQYHALFPNKSIELDELWKKRTAP
jgi:hypothetical protein